MLFRSISKVEVECRGEDMQDPDFCHHITFVTDRGKEIRIDDHVTTNFGEFVAAVQNHVVTEEQRGALNVVIKRYAGVKHNGTD